MITRKEAIEAMLAGKEVLDTDDGVWDYRFDRFGCSEGNREWIACDVCEFEFTKIIEPKLSYSVDLWLKYVPRPGKSEGISLREIIFGTEYPVWSSTCMSGGKKYKITIEDGDSE